VERRHLLLAPPSLPDGDLPSHTPLATLPKRDGAMAKLMQTLSTTLLSVADSTDNQSVTTEASAADGRVIFEDASYSGGAEGVLRVPSGWQQARNGGRRNGQDDYHRLRSLLQDFEEIFIAMHGRRPTPTECAADATYHAFYARYAAAKKERELALLCEQGKQVGAAPQVQSAEEVAPTGGYSNEQQGTEELPSGDRVSAPSSDAYVRGSAADSSLWLQLLGGGSALGHKRPLAELETAAFPSRLHTRPRTYASTACQTAITGEFPPLSLLLLRSPADGSATASSHTGPTEQHGDANTAAPPELL